MGQSLADFGVTLTVGTFFLLGMFVLSDLCWPSALVTRLVRSERVLRPISLALGMAVVALVGMLAEDLADKLDDQIHQSSSPAVRKYSERSNQNWLALVLPFDRRVRASTLLREDIRTQFRDVAGVDSSLICAAVDSSVLHLLSRDELSEIELEQAMSTSVNRINAVYYAAKNRVFREDNYYDELRYYVARTRFGRSITLSSVALALAALVSMLLVVRPPQGFSRADTAKRSGTLLFVFLGVYLVGRIAYEAEVAELAKRVYGYYISLHLGP